ncbi:MAG: alpha/beta hydrolase [Acidobacteriota bacterium]|nr:MAG: alpha/beta hydrolase [Acidobacteriota bacterium]
MAPVARRLADCFSVLEPLQRGSGSEPLTVARHIRDLYEVVGRSGQRVAPALVGSSWGAMLALAFACAHPDSAGPLVLIGCGTFDRESRDRFRLSIEQRMDESVRHRLERLENEVEDPDERLRAMAQLLLPVYSYELIAAGDETENYDSRAHRETWEDMLRLQDQGVYPAAFSAINAPVLMLHGTEDPHPGQMIRASLAPYIRQLEYLEWERCGHYPWLERAVRERFFAVLRNWLERRLRQ